MGNCDIRMIMIIAIITKVKQTNKTRTVRPGINKSHNYNDFKNLYSELESCLAAVGGGGSGGEYGKW